MCCLEVILRLVVILVAVQGMPIFHQGGYSFIKIASHNIQRKGIFHLSASSIILYMYNNKFMTVQIL